MFTVQISYIASIATVLLGQHSLRHMLVQRIDGAVKVNALTDFLLQEWAHKVNDCVDEWRYVDYVYFL